LIVHEDNLSFGVGAEVSARIMEGAFADLDAPVMRCTGPDVPAMPFAPTLEAVFMPTADKIAASLRTLLEY
jgi:2-oxoisovalerate dehydrogenase E1 component beta subunit